MSQEAIEGLKPELIWQRFYELTQIPRPSKKEEKVLKYVRKFASDNNLVMREDKVGNIVIEVPATQGCENSPVVVLQGHVDMVCEKNKGTVHDFENDPLTIQREGDWIKASGTTLGADNGIGVAASFAAVHDKEMVHGPLEILCTVDEETGMTGVNNLEPGFITGKVLLNMDSEEDGTFYVGCAGGQDTVGFIPLDYTNTSQGFYTYELMITGLSGGHSGLDIHRGKGNAIKLLARLLKEIKRTGFELAHISGGSLRNAIPREAEALININPDSMDEVKEIIEKFQKEAMLEYKVTDPGLMVKFKKSDSEQSKVIAIETTNKMLNVLYALPHGVITMSPDIENLVETSTNLATLEIQDNSLRIGTSQRSSIETAKMNVVQIVKSVFDLAGVKTEEGDGYPGWQPNMESGILNKSIKVYKQLFNREPEIKAIHAGLETGLLGAKYPGLDMISFGPTIMGAHSPDEKVNIKDVEKFYNLLKGILAELAKN